jgi:hypothetical protein
MLFVVKVLNKTAEVMIMGRAVELTLSYADGMIGCMPVFETKEQAESFADGGYEIFEIVTTPSNVTCDGKEKHEEKE